MSLNRILQIVKSTGETISLPILKDYLEYMEDAYLVFPISNLASPISEQMTIKKRYFVDNGLLNLFLFKGETHLLENIVALDLIRRFINTPEETLLFYYNKNIEVDFCVPSDNLALQVSYSIEESTTYNREIGSLVKFLSINPGYKGYIITRDEEREIIAGDITINVVPVWKWLIR